MSVFAVCWRGGYHTFEDDGPAACYLTWEEAEAEQARIAAAIERSRRAGILGSFDGGLAIVEIETGGHVEVGEHMYLYRFLQDDPKPETDHVWDLFVAWYRSEATRIPGPPEIFRLNEEAEERAKALGIAPERLYGLLVPF